MKKLSLIRRNKKLQSVVLVAAAVTLGAIIAIPQHAFALGSMYLTPSKSTVQAGENFTVAVRINPGAPINAATLTVTYDDSKISAPDGAAALNTGGSAFTHHLGTGDSGGEVRIDSAIFGGGSTSTDSLIVTINFTAIANTGTSAISIVNDDSVSNAYRLADATPTNPSRTGATMSFTSPSAPTPPPSSGGGGGSGGTGGSGSGGTRSGSSSASPSTPGAAITATPAGSSGMTVQVNESNVQYSKAGLKIGSSANAKVTVRYGAAPDQLLLQTSQTAESTSHDVSIDESTLSPGTTYYYQVVAEGTDGSVAATEVASFKTKGFTVEASVKDKNGNAVKDSKLTLHSDPIEGTTNGDGKVTFSDVSPGTHSIKYSNDGKEHSAEIMVENSVTTDGEGNQTAQPQSFSIVYTDLEQAALPIRTVSILAAVFVLIAGIVAIMFTGQKPGGPFDGIKRRFARPKKGNVSAAGTSASVVSASEVTAPNSEHDNNRIFNLKAPEQEAPGSVISPNSGGEAGSGNA